LAINVDAVTIEQIEKEIIEHAYDNNLVKPIIPRQKTGKKAAVVGSGPAGMAAAQQLARAGHEVDLFEKNDRIGGLLRYGIPDFKMEKWVIDRRMEQMEAEGVNFRTSVDVGNDISWNELTNDYDAVIICVGAQKPRDLQAENREKLNGIHFAMEFLEQQNREVAGDELDEDARVHAEGKDVVILGGGDTGSDCLGTALRQKAKTVKQIELFPAPPETRKEDNPWPQWPMIFKTSASQEEGGERHFALMTKRLEGDGEGNLKKLHAARIEVTKDEDGNTQLEDTGEMVELDCDLLVLAMGYTGPLADDIEAQLGIRLGPRGTIDADDAFRTNIDNVYVAGDAYRGASLIVWAISDGREAARAADKDLMGETRLPTRGMNQPFGGR
jgi:glutamate synthase (NADPH/NADH) small chain